MSCLICCFSALLKNSAASKNDLVLFFRTESEDASLALELENLAQHIVIFKVKYKFLLRWQFPALKSVSMGRYNHSLSLDAAIMVSQICPIIGEHVVIIFAAQ